MQENLPNIIADGGKGKLRPIISFLRVTILVCHSTGTPVRTTQTIQADDVEPGHIESLTRATQQGTPPIGHVRATTQCMANHQDIVTVGRKFTPRGVSDRHIVERNTRFEGERRYYHGRLVCDKLRVRVLR